MLSRSIFRSPRIHRSTSSFDPETLPSSPMSTPAPSPAPAGSSSSPSLSRQRSNIKRDRPFRPSSKSLTPFLRRKMRVVSNKENTSASRQPDGEGRTTSSTGVTASKPRIRGIGRPAHRAHPHVKHRLSSVQRAKEAANKTRTKVEATQTGSGCMTDMDVDPVPGDTSTGPSVATAANSSTEKPKPSPTLLIPHSAPPPCSASGGVTLSTICESSREASEAPRPDSDSGEQYVRCTHLRPPAVPSHLKVLPELISVYADLVHEDPDLVIKRFEFRSLKPVTSAKQAELRYFLAKDMGFPLCDLFVNSFLPEHPIIHVTDTATGTIASFIHKAVRPYLSMDRSGHYTLQLPGQTPLLVPTMFIAPPMSLPTQSVCEKLYEQVLFPETHRAGIQLFDVRSIPPALVPLRFHPYPSPPSDASGAGIAGNAQPPLQSDIRPVFQYPFLGIDIPRPQNLEYLSRLRAQEKNIPLLDGHRLSTTTRPAEIWKHHPAVLTARRAYDGAVASRARGENVPLPELPKFTTLFPAMPQRSLLSDKGETIWPFHAVPWKLEMTQAPTIEFTNEDGIRVPHPFAYNAIYDVLPSMGEISMMFELCPQNMWPQAPQSNMSGGSPIEIMPEEYKFLPFWVQESVFHRGLHPRGAALVQTRGPNICLIVRSLHSQSHEHKWIPINKSVLSTTCANIERLFIKSALKYRSVVASRQNGSSNGQAGSPNRSMESSMTEKPTPPGSPATTTRDLDNSGPTTPPASSSPAPSDAPDVEDNTQSSEGSYATSSSTVSDEVGGTMPNSPCANYPGEGDVWHESDSDIEITSEAFFELATVESVEAELVEGHPYFQTPLHEDLDLRNVDVSADPGKYGLKTLPLMPLYLPDPTTFHHILWHLHNPEMDFTPVLLGFLFIHRLVQVDVIKDALFALSPVECLRVARCLHNMVRNLKALGVVTPRTWHCVRKAHAILADVLWHRGAMPNPKLNHFAIPYMDGEDLPALTFAHYTPTMVQQHVAWAASRVAELEAEGRIPKDQSAPPAQEDAPM